MVNCCAASINTTADEDGNGYGQGPPRDRLVEPANIRCCDPELKRRWFHRRRLNQADGEDTDGILPRRLQGELRCQRRHRDQNTTTDLGSN